MNQAFHSETGEPQISNIPVEPGENFTKNELKLRLIKMGINFDMCLDRGQLVRLYDIYINKKEFKAKIEDKLQSDKKKNSMTDLHSDSVPAKKSSNITPAIKSNTIFNGPFYGLNTGKPQIPSTLKNEVREEEKIILQNIGIKDIKNSALNTSTGSIDIKNLTDEREKHKKRKSEEGRFVKERDYTATQEELDLIKLTLDKVDMNQNQGRGFQNNFNLGPQSDISNNSLWKIVNPSVLKPSTIQSGIPQKFINPFANMNCNSMIEFPNRLGDQKQQALNNSFHSINVDNKSVPEIKKEPAFINFKQPLNFNSSKLTNRPSYETPNTETNLSRSGKEVEEHSSSNQTYPKGSSINTFMRNTSSDFSHSKTLPKKNDHQINATLHEEDKQSSIAFEDIWPVLIFIIILLLLINLKFTDHRESSPNVPLISYFTSALEFSWSIFSSIFQGAYNLFIAPVSNGLTSLFTAQTLLLTILALGIFTGYKYFSKRSDIASEICNHIRGRLHEMCNERGREDLGISEDQVVEEYSTKYQYSETEFRDKILPELINQLRLDLNIIEIIQSRSESGSIIVWKWLDLNYRR